MSREKIIAGNWKMNNTNEEAAKLVSELIEKVKNVKDRKIIVAPSFTCLSDVQKAINGTNIKLSAQNMYFEESGAFTGQVSADMLKAVNCEYVILGHSECRHIFGECDTLINKKVKKAIEKNIIPILCIGEKLEEREAGITDKVVSEQTAKGYEGLTEEMAKKVIIAYEPVWAIGTGKTATPDDADSVHKTVRNVIEKLYSKSLADSTVILYGGSVNDTNADELLNMPNIDGALVGGAALKADKFARIVNFIKK